jgi:hypothetical protein
MSVIINGVEYAPVKPQQTVPATTSVRVPQPKMVERKCKWCKGLFLARSADVKRGWGLYCSKSCKASKQEKRTGQYRNMQRDDNEPREFSDAHLFSNEEHDCNKD